MAQLTKVSEKRCFEGLVQRWQHKSKVLGEECDKMNFTVFIPPTATAESKAPIVYFLSGLTCNDENFITKAGAQREAAELGIALICPDTSPRGCKIEGDSDSWDFGVAAGFYVNATEEKWKKNYNMYSYVTEELPELLKEIPQLDTSRASIMGHSMGGHGALICALKNSQNYQSVSAFAPISNPINCPWGVKAFTGYLGDNKESWKQWDASELARNYSGRKLTVLIDQGSADNFYTDKQLQPEIFAEAASKQPELLEVAYNLREGYDHSYYFIQTFIGTHLHFHYGFLSQGNGSQ